MIDIESIAFILENCELIEIPVELVTDLYFDEYKKVFTKRAINSIDMTECFNLIYLTLDSSVKDVMISSFSEDDEIGAVKRLSMFQDIVAIKVSYKTDSNKEDFVVYAPWESDGHDGNTNQIMLFNKKEDVQLIIASPETLNKYKGTLRSLNKRFDDREIEHKLNKIQDLH